MGYRIRGSTGGSAIFLFAIVLGTAATVLAAPPDLVIDRAAQSIKVGYIPKPDTKEIRIKLTMQEGTTLKDLESRKVIVPKEREVTESFSILLVKNCAYIVEVEEGGERSRAAKNLYDPKSRPEPKKSQLSGLLGVPLEQIGSFLEKVTSSILLNPEAKNIFRIEVDTKAVTKLTLINEGTVTAPMVSSEGSRVAFVWNRGGRQEIGILNINAAPAKPDAIKVIGQGSSPIWWPKETKLLYLREGKIRQQDLAEGVEQVLFPGGIDFLTRLLGWTRDGRLLATVRLGTFDQLWLIDMRTGNFTLLDYDEAFLFLPRISPDRKSIVHARWPGAGQRTSLFSGPSAAP